MDGLVRTSCGLESDDDISETSIRASVFSPYVILDTRSRLG